MQINVNTNPLIRKFLRVYYMTSLREPTSDMFKFADFFTPAFLKAAEVSEIIYNVSHSDKKTNSLLWQSLFDRNLNNNSKSELTTKLRKLLDEIDLKTIKQNDSSLENAKKSLIADYNKFKGSISDWVYKIFGFKMPESIDIILDISPRFGQGNFITDDPPLIALSYPSYDLSRLSTMLHEILHLLISKNDMKNKLASVNPVFEEALLDYFSPYGILDEKVGLKKTPLAIREHQRQQVQNRPASAQLSNNLLPAMEEYYKICGDETIWEFLKKKKLINF